MSQHEDPIEEYLDQIDELTHKLSVAESKLKSLQSDQKLASNLKYNTWLCCPSFYCVVMYVVVVIVYIVFKCSRLMYLYITWKVVRLLITMPTMADYH